jgi:hypothetical protein
MLDYMPLKAMRYDRCEVIFAGCGSWICTNDLKVMSLKTDALDRPASKEQSCCSEWTGNALQTEHCCTDWTPAEAGFWDLPCRAICRAGLKWCGG